MDEDKMIKVIQKARKNPTLLNSDDYINAQLSRDSLVALTLQMGPNCNLCCPTCYGYYGPARDGLPGIEIVEKVLREALQLKLRTVQLSDGEPIREENREVIRIVAQYSREFSVWILTNGAFAKTDQSAIGWFEFLRENGFELARKSNLFQVSFGAGYEVHRYNYDRLNTAIRDQFPDSDFSKHLEYSCLIFGDPSENERIKQVIRSLWRIFEGEGEVTFAGTLGKDLRYNIPLKQGGNIILHCSLCEPQGRGANIPFLERFYPKRELGVDEMYFSPMIDEMLWIAHDGKVSFGSSGGCVRQGKFYGNIKDISLSEVKSRIHKDSIYWAHKLGGVRFLYFLAQSVEPGFRVIGRIKCDACHKFFGDVSLMETVRKKLDNKGVADLYKEYMIQVGLR
jgi:hypothetical protein